MTDLFQRLNIIVIVLLICLRSCRSCEAKSAFPPTHTLSSESLNLHPVKVYRARCKTHRTSTGAQCWFCYYSFWGEIWCNCVWATSCKCVIRSSVLGDITNPDQMIVIILISSELHLSSYFGMKRRLGSQILKWIAAGRTFPFYHF